MVDSPLLHRDKATGKVVYAVAYQNPLPRVRYILATGHLDAMRQVLRSKASLGKVISVAPAIGAYGKHTERKRIYLFG